MPACPVRIAWQPPRLPRPLHLASALIRRRHRAFEPDALRAAAPKMVAAGAARAGFQPAGQPRTLRRGED
jgi:hypothetical protein